MIKLDHISASSLNGFKWCARKYLYSKLGYPIIATDTYRRDLGKDIHLAIKEYFDSLSDEPSEEEIRKKATESFENYKIPKRFLESFLRFELERKKKWRRYLPTFVEKPLEASVFEGYPPVSVVVDFYSEAEETIIDWKTGSEEVDLIQGGLYSLVLKKLGYPVRKFLFVNLRTGLTQPLPLVTEGFLRKEIDLFLDSIKNNRFPPNRGNWCRNCEYLLRCELEKECFWEW